jgi:hypothetical protein
LKPFVFLDLFDHEGARFAMPRRTLRRSARAFKKPIYSLRADQKMLNRVKFYLVVTGRPSRHLPAFLRKKVSRQAAMFTAVRARHPRATPSRLHHLAQ